MNKPLSMMLVLAAFGLALTLTACDSANDKTDSAATAPPTYKPSPAPKRRRRTNPRPKTRDTRTSLPGGSKPRPGQSTG